jgi:GrpB-like predicted nucleotidyltransferase (UPF0157 family)
MADRLAQMTVGELHRVNGVIELVDYDPAWPAMFAWHRERIVDALADRVVVLEHVGSTSVPGLAGKPRIDILLVVPDSGNEEAYIPALETAGYVLRIREPEWYQHRVMVRNDRQVNVHIFSPGCVEIDRMIGFRDWLRTHPDDRQRYEDAKRSLAARNWEFVQEYADAKTEVVEAIIARALENAERSSGPDSAGG